MSHSRTLWEEGIHPAGLVIPAACVATSAVVLLDVLLTGRITLLFDVAFVAVCLTAALTVRPREFFAIGVMPPLLMFAAVLVLSRLARPAVAQPEDGLVQATVSGLAHHAGALVAGYGVTLIILAIRQAALSGLRGASDRPRLNA